MRVVALLQTFNERRFLATCIEHLNAQGVEVYVIDNESTDDTVSIAERYLGRGVIGIEQLPRDGCFDLVRQLERKQELAHSLEADWFMHIDADEIHEVPERGKTLSEAFAVADERGFNAINFLEFAFVPTLESPDHDHPEFVKTMEWYHPVVHMYPHRLNAWKRQDQPVELASSDGHVVAFDGLRMSPRILHMRHYMFLSVQHACEKWSREYDPVRGTKMLSDGAWRVAFDAARVALPSERDLRRARPGQPLDHREPSNGQLAIRTDMESAPNLAARAYARTLVPARAPLRIIAILQTFNERRFVAGCIEHLIAHGVDVYVIDHESTDETLEIVESYQGRGVVGIEHMARNGLADWHPQYQRKAELAASLEADWFMHVDADERHEPRDRRQTLADAFADADELGFNAVNFLEFTFVPTIEAPEHDHPEFEQTMRWYYPFLWGYPHRLNAWKRQEQPVDLVSTDGHRVAFPGLRLFPRNLHMRHYHFLGLEHAYEKYVRKIHPARVKRQEGKDWTIGFRQERLVLPSQRDMRRWEPGERLDHADPEGRHLFLTSDWETTDYPKVPLGTGLEADPD